MKDNAVYVVIGGVLTDVLGDDTTDKLYLPDNVESIAQDAFSKVQYVEYISIPSSILELDSKAFADLDELEIIDVDETNNYYYSLDGIVYDKINNMIAVIPMAIKSANLPDSITEIPKRMFSKRHYLEYVSIPDGVERIEDEAFYCCDRLRKIRLPNTLEYIGKYAFSRCESMSELDLPESLTTIDDSAFNFCSNLTEVHIPGTLQELGSGFFHCIGLRHFSIYDTTKILDPHIAGQCYNLETITIHSHDWSVGYRFHTDLTNIKKADRSTDTTDLFIFLKDPRYETFCTLKSGKTKAQIAVEYIDADDRYMEYLQKSGKKVACLLMDVNNITLFLKFLKLDILKSSNIDDVIDHAAKNDNIEYSSYLLDYKQRRLGGKGRSLTQMMSISSSKVWQSSSKDKSLLGRYKGDDTIVEFPSQLNGIKIRGVADCNATPENYRKIKRIILPEGYEYIGKRAFADCDELLEVVIPSTVTTINDGAFSGCPSLKTITIPPSVKKLGNRVFAKCSSLTDIVLSEGLERIGAECFGDCESLDKVVLPQTLNDIGKNAFKNCTSLKSATLPDNMTEVPEYLFSRCISLNNVIIPYGVTKFCQKCFEFCRSLDHINIPARTVIIEFRAFYSTGLKAVVLPLGIEELDNGVFEECTELTDVNLPDSLKRIGDACFMECDLKTVFIPDSVKELDRFAFYGNTSLCASIPYHLRKRANQCTFDNCRSVEVRPDVGR